VRETLEHSLNHQFSLLQSKEKVFHPVNLAVNTGTFQVIFLSAGLGRPPTYVLCGDAPRALNRNSAARSELPVLLMELVRGAVSLSRAEIIN